MDHNQVEEQLKMIRVKPLTATEKNILWSNIAARLRPVLVHSGTRKHTVFRILRGNKRAWTAALLVLSLLGGGATVAAADTSRPGDLLFPVDLAVEKIRLVIAPEKNKDTLRIQFAEERVGEARSTLEEFAAAAFATATEGQNVAELSVKGRGDSQRILMQMTASSTSAGTATGTTATTSATSSSIAVSPNATLKVERDIDEKSVENAKRALEVALAQLESAKANLNPENTTGKAALDRMIADLRTLAETHIGELESFTADIREKNGNLKVKIEASTDDLKTKFKFEERNGKYDTGESVSYSSSTSGSTMSISVKDTGVSIELKEKRDNGNSKSNSDKKDKDGSEKHKEKSKHDDDDEEDDEDGDDDHSNGKKAAICHTPPGNADLAHAIQVAKESLKAHLAHGDKFGTCGEPEATTTPDTVAPLITNITETTGTSTVAITWTTNEVATSKIWYGTSTPFALGTPTPSNGSSSLVTAHTVMLSSLTASTTHYYVVESKDASGNIATSSVRSFATLQFPPPSDTAAPVISALSASGTTANSTTIVWTTDETATSRVWYATTTPIALTSALTEGSASLVTSHAVLLPFLTASTTYYYVAVSKDASGNTATSTESTFTAE